MFESCLQKQKEVINLFKGCATPEERYQKIIELGKKQSRLSNEYKLAENIVPGCQSRMYVRSWEQDGKVYFESESDALISAGLAMLLILVYSGETPETILKCTPQHIEELGIRETLTPGRSNGLASLYIRMKQDALRHLLNLK
jgi:cysteine desulfuration protein SufE